MTLDEIIALYERTMTVYLAAITPPHQIVTTNCTTVVPARITVASSTNKETRS